MNLLGYQDKVTLPFERRDIGEGYASSGKVETRQATPEECRKYGINKLADLRRRVFADLDLNWNPQAEAKAVRLWEKGMDIPEIARALKRDEWETLLLMLHLLREGKVDDRGLGWVKEN